MGAWAADAFGNDTACDWSYRLSEVDDLSVIRESLDAVEECDDFIDADIGSEALAACEVLARLKGNWGERNSYTATADSWIEKNNLDVPEALLRQANQVIDAVLSSESELRELWGESEDGEWLQVVKDLRKRLK
jgi:hypothetical protein